jgi:hypothetical protein
VSDNALEEVVVTALGITREAKSLGYAQQKVEGAALTKTKELDFKTALAGKVAGVRVFLELVHQLKQVLLDLEVRWMYYTL